MILAFKSNTGTIHNKQGSHFVLKGGIDTGYKNIGCILFTKQNHLENSPTNFHKWSYGKYLGYSKYINNEKRQKGFFLHVLCNPFLGAEQSLFMIAKPKKEA